MTSCGDAGERGREGAGERPGAVAPIPLPPDPLGRWLTGSAHPAPGEDDRVDPDDDPDDDEEPASG